jgi:hypothetical protein
MVARHLKILERCSLRLLGRVYVPLKRAIKKPLLPLRQELQRYILANTQITVRQFYYHCISIGLKDFPKTSKQAKNTYASIDNQINQARLSGEIPMDSIADNTSLLGTTQWDSIEQLLTAASRQYRSKWFEDQEYYVEVWLEKEALAQIFAQITDNYGVFLSVSGGYPKISQINSGIHRFREYSEKPVKLLYFGDLDASGKDMINTLRDNMAKLRVENDVEVIEVALNISDVEDFDLVKNPVKEKDKRKKWFTETYGIDYGVELDALEPDILRNKIHRAICDYVDLAIVEECKANDAKCMNEWEGIITIYEDE